MSLLSGIGLELGIGIAIGMLAGTTGTHGSARGRMTLLAAAIGLVAGFLLAGPADLSAPAGAAFCMLAAAAACIVVSDVVGAAGRRSNSGGGALGFLVSMAALVVVAASILVKPLAFAFLAVLAWLAAARSRRSRRKHAGLRVLR